MGAGMADNQEQSRYNGLAGWRARQAEEKRLKLLELEHYRSYATIEVRDGREFTVVKIPDRYDWTVKPPEPPVQRRGQKNRLRAA